MLINYATTLEQVQELPPGDLAAVVVMPPETPEDKPEKLYSARKLTPELLKFAVYVVNGRLETEAEAASQAEFVALACRTEPDAYAEIYEAV